MSAPILINTSNISIHALRGEGDVFPVCRDSHEDYFNPRPPWGGRLAWLDSNGIKPLFQSTPSVGRATDVRWNTKRLNSISIHALRGEGDLGQLSISSPKSISIHALRGEGDRQSKCQKNQRQISIHALRGEGDLGQHRQKHCSGNISIHALRGEGDRILVRDFSSDFGEFQSTPSVGRATRG